MLLNELIKSITNWGQIEKVYRNYIQITLYSGNSCKIKFSGKKGRII
jgi:hypothetical protein